MSKQIRAESPASSAIGENLFWGLSEPFGQRKIRRGEAGGLWLPPAGTHSVSFDGGDPGI